MNRDLETLSAFLDGETSELETRRVMRDIDDTELETLSRWQLAQDVMHGQSCMAVPADFNAGLSAALAAEGAPAKRPAWLGGMARLAVAASVAAATVVGWQTWEGNLGGPGADVAPALAAAQDSRLNRPFAEASLVSQSFGTGSAVVTPATASPRVNEMLLRHSDFAARNSGQGMMPLARLVSMDARSGAK